MSNPENLLKVSKKGKTLMMFVSTSDDLSKEETEEITKLWQTGLWNNHIQVERYSTFYANKFSCYFKLICTLLNCSYYIADT